ncbi:hypothetical protein [Legionella sp. km772]|uniref:hypothetical protein n=1 Tax=Legionella sp. km772 TaxID=2498111 RepID=UPI000F8DD7CC|nr:hypothetical protein [Legionella sp. km772]RUR05289.1 hypothetical protein ELY15_14475 [Legionella sp. km772]
MADPDVKLTHDSNTIRTPEEFALDLAKSGTDNYLNMNEPLAGAMTQLLGDGVPGPMGNELTGTDDQIEQEIEAEENNYNGPSMTPHP